MSLSVRRASVMACELVFSRSAERDRDRIVEYLLYDVKSPQAAGHFLDELDEALDLVCSNPALFAVSREPRLARLGYRPCLFMKHIALYKHEDGVVKVARIFHQSQDYARLV
ncbi:MULTISPECIES: type II toxin-antitoxin system RelE/ParE family toxin [Gordonibacter]|uniref:Type II toxin-antitoxin system RelE/ParE family toxin n=1 Tax=Gordonibacter faecis TaxID=3047475 RepID=A0ABT7DL12_9ACTN|nr:MULTISPECIES: type II toxin-antitoxin system RelE/ParE family toxin [unclassified Gordonibacter]MDJ1650216.1 type II toxin-antitoxin system RelE/ParE family toxin [Gordonibacter sp. KGMB12511]HIW75950.1 type II toxin-antitoxin system RelE/ParE family toxin [Candidatus Gordonibacter avicola]